MYSVRPTGALRAPDQVRVQKGPLVSVCDGACCFRHVHIRHAQLGAQALAGRAAARDRATVAGGDDTLHSRHCLAGVVSVGCALSLRAFGNFGAAILLSSMPCCTLLRPDT